MALQNTTASGFDQIAWDLFTRYALRPELFFDRLATVKADKADKQGHTVRFSFTADLAAATTPLTEDSDVTPVSYGDSTVDVTLAEYGNAVKTTALLRGTAFIPIDVQAANVIGYNAGLSLDTLARDVLMAGDNVIYGGDATDRGGAGTGLVAADVLTASMIRQTVASLRKASVRPVKASLYPGFVNPDVSVDLREETGAAAWREPHVYSAPGQIWNGEIGSFEGVFFMEAPRCPILTDAGDGAVDVYQTLVVGQEALAKAYSETVSAPLPVVKPGPITDTLMRHVPIGWFWLGGYGILREEAVRRIETSSSLGAN